MRKPQFGLLEILVGIAAASIVLVWYMSCVTYTASAVLTVETADSSVHANAIKVLASEKALTASIEQLPESERRRAARLLSTLEAEYARGTKSTGTAILTLRVKGRHKSCTEVLDAHVVRSLPRLLPETSFVRQSIIVSGKTNLVDLVSAFLIGAILLLVFFGRMILEALVIIGKVLPASEPINREITK